MLICIFHTAYSQSFFTDYIKYMNGRYYNANHKYLNDNSFKVEVKRMKKLFKKTNQQMGISMLACDTLFMINYYGVSLSARHILFWNKYNMCSYDYSYELRNEKRIDKKLYLDTHAWYELNLIEPGIKKWVETADTSQLNNYGAKHDGFEGDAISFRIAIKEQGNWHFISSHAYRTVIEKN